MSLRKKTISGIVWTFGQQISVQAINLIVQIVLARILLPEDFGVIAILSVFMAVGITLTDSGLSSSLIRTKDADQGDYSTVFFINLIGSVLIYLIIFLFAPLIASFFSLPILTPVVRVYCLGFIIRAFSQVQQTRLTKKMNFKLQMTIQIPSVLIAGLIGVYLAYNDFGVWSLVLMNLIQNVLVTIQLWLRTKWKPSLIINKGKLISHLNFGYKLTLSGLLNTVFNNIYNVIIGRYFSASELGFYNRADTLRMFPVQNLSSALNKVTYPMFASINNDDEKMKKVYKSVMVQVVFWLTPMLVILILVAEPLFRFVLTDKWLPAVPYFQILCISSVLYPLHAYNLNILNVKGRSDLFLKLEIIKKAIIIIGIAIAIPFGIYGLLYFQVIGGVIAYFINSFYSGKMIGYSMVSQLWDILPIFIIACIIGVGGYNALLFTEGKGLHDLLVISILSFIYMGAYLLLAYLFKLSALKDFKKIILRK